MFTGIITHMGRIKEKSKEQFFIETPDDLYKKLTLGMSVSVNGICLTVTSLKDSFVFTINFMPETAKKTNIRYLKEGDIVNLELPVTPETLFAGHIVQGHVDNMSKILSIESEGNSRIITFSVDPELTKYMVDKGSVSVNGISLTVIRVTDDQFTVGIIPYTWEHTMLHTSKVGDFVNIEVDVLAKYLEKFVVNNKE